MDRGYDAAKADRRAANPFKKQLASAEEHHARVVKDLEDSKVALLSTEEQLAKVTKQTEFQKAAVIGSSRKPLLK